MPELSEVVKAVIRKQYKPGVAESVEKMLLAECTDKVPGGGGESIQLAVLKASNGNQNDLIEAIMLAQIDWRDLYLWAKFTNPEANQMWLDELTGEAGKYRITG